ncbi:hypothetical protein N5I28_15970 [Pseudomonas mosselii]|uniref:Lipoprotein n=1 Tax=Pseudomonas mosselii TaxID=78327 RepID=A0A7W2PXP0_9PSED|nr:MULTISPECIES: hypothetical protein [Pseudomonas]MBC7210893.1 hypothetical protein [Pseudomonas sp.]KXG79285.1 hypothetical protein AXZ07_06860 [Pseudomonas mosselii]MBA6064654.1 hypothetical protein [Pseudomonas mosselii]MBC3459157.1 hypothetical protein [Pseudomonas mosselii]MBH3312936.1 hypothetical protein [Pseudomonas mosselii]
MSRYWLGVCVVLLLAGCETTHEQMVNQGYPPAYADGFQDGCSSGRQAAGLMAGDFRKDVPRYLHNRQYESGWDDGFRQCHAMQSNEDLREYRERYWDERDRDWQQEKDQGAARAYRRK